MVIALLFAQAMLDLALPDYLARIVNTGVQLSGIETAVPEALRQERLEQLVLFMSDEDETAVREAFEEIGLLREEINLIGSLSNLYIPVSRYMVQPFISYGLNHPDFKINKDEVQEVIPLRIKDLSKPEIISAKQIKTFEGIIRDVPCFILNDITIWGATAMMVSEILDLGMAE